MIGGVTNADVQRLKELWNFAAGLPDFHDERPSTICVLLGPPDRTIQTVTQLNSQPMYTYRILMVAKGNPRSLRYSLCIRGI